MAILWGELGSMAWIGLPSSDHVANIVHIYIYKYTLEYSIKEPYSDTRTHSETYIHTHTHAHTHTWPGHGYSFDLMHTIWGCVFHIYNDGF